MKQTLILYGSLRAGDSQTLAKAVSYQLALKGVEPVIYYPQDLPMFDYESFDHPKTVELHNLALWADSYVWISPEYHGGPSGVLKNVIDWLPGRDRAEKATQGKPVAIMSTTGGAQSFNTINTLTVTARWLKMPVVQTHVNWAHAHEGMSDAIKQRIRAAADEIAQFSER